MSVIQVVLAFVFCTCRITACHQSLRNHVIAGRSQIEEHLFGGVDSHHDPLAECLRLDDAAVVYLHAFLLDNDEHDESAKDKQSPIDTSKNHKTEPNGLE